MTRAAQSTGTAGESRSVFPVGGFLDDLPSGLYALAHVGFLAVGVWLWLRASGDALPYTAGLALYAVSQIGFLAYFAHAITMKMAVLLEQTLILALVLLVVLRAA